MWRFPLQTAKVGERYVSVDFCCCLWLRILVVDRLILGLSLKSCPVCYRTKEKKENAPLASVILQGELALGQPITLRLTV